MGLIPPLQQLCTQFLLKHAIDSKPFPIPFERIPLHILYSLLSSLIQQSPLSASYLISRWSHPSLDLSKLKLDSSLLSLVLSAVQKQTVSKRKGVERKITKLNVIGCGVNEQGTNSLLLFAMGVDVLEDVKGMKGVDTRTRFFSREGKLVGLGANQNLLNDHQKTTPIISCDIFISPSNIQLATYVFGLVHVHECLRINRLMFAYVGDTIKLKNLLLKIFNGSLMTSCLDGLSLDNCESCSSFSLGPFYHSSCSEQLKFLQLKYNRISDISTLLLPLQSLSELVLTGNVIPDISTAIELISGMSQLTSISITFSWLNATKIASLLRGLSNKNISKLDLEGNILSGSSTTEMNQELSRFSNSITSLNFAHQRLSSSKLNQLIKVLQEFKNLQFLNIEGNIRGTEDGNPRTLDHLLTLIKKCSTLKVLKADFNFLDIDQVTNFLLEIFDPSELPSTNLTTLGNFSPDSKPKIEQSLSLLSTKNSISLLYGNI